MEVYDEWGLLHENAEEAGLPFEDSPMVCRTEIEVEPGRTISAVVWGKGDPQIVLIHGGGQNAHTWDTVALALRPIPLVAIDLPGHGHSGRPSDDFASNPPMAAAADLAVAVRAVASNAAGVVGMSMGGLVALALTDVAPELVRCLLLVDVLPGISAAQGQHIHNFVNGPSTFRDFDELLERTIRFNPQRSVSSLRRGVLHNAVQLEDGTWAWRHARWHLDFLHDPSSDDSGHASAYDDLVDVLRRANVPVLLARGMRADSVLRDADEAAFRNIVPTGDVVRFYDAGHSIQGDMPLELAGTIRKFVLGSG
jgi:pimeloyl-ACP methyl ester carboxylesterase